MENIIQFSSYYRLLYKFIIWILPEKCKVTQNVCYISLLSMFGVCCELDKLNLKEYWSIKKTLSHFNKALILPHNYGVDK